MDQQLHSNKDIGSQEGVQVDVLGVQITCTICGTSFILRDARFCPLASQVGVAANDNGVDSGHWNCPNCFREFCKRGGTLWAVAYRDEKGVIHWPSCGEDRESALKVA